jgi:hypothetical protein
MRLAVFAVAVFLAGCSPAPQPAAHETALPPWYGSTVDQLAALNHQAEDSFQSGKSDQAAAKIKEAQSLAARVLAVPQPPLAAVEAASDLDDLYGRMLLANRNYGWAQMFFQKNRARWKHWTPQTPESVRRLKQAESAIQECDRHLSD